MSTPLTRIDAPGGRTLVFRVGQEQFGLPLASVLEVFESTVPPTPVPGAPGWVAGVINHHGQVVPVIRMRIFVGTVNHSPDQEPQGPTRIVLTELGEAHFGLEVDQIESIEELRTEGADFQGKKRSWYRGALLEMVEPERLAEDIGRRLEGRDSTS